MKEPKSLTLIISPFRAQKNTCLEKEIPGPSDLEEKLKLFSQNPRILQANFHLI